MKESIISLAGAAQITASADGDAFDVGGYGGPARLILSASATDGADNTLDVKIQHSADGATNWTDTGVEFAQVTNAAASHQEVPVNVDAFHRYIRAVDTVAGTTPGVARAVLLVARPERTA